MGAEASKQEAPIRRKDNKKPDRKPLPGELPLKFLSDITKGFSADQKLGEGAFGVVYKGILPSGEIIAVKKLRSSPADQDKHFRNEVVNLMVVEHENIVKLTGHCYEHGCKVVESNGQMMYNEATDKLLCYEYLPEGSLDKHLFDDPCKLDWPMRFNIINGICGGLRFLHEGYDNHPIIHLDLKPSNILLDGNMSPKIADFGLSRLFGKQQTRTYTQNVVGSIGYMAPEYLERGEITTKCDIYSLGMLIIEITTGEKNSHPENDASGRFFIENVCQNWKNREYVTSKYSSLDSEHLTQIETCIEIALNCVAAMPRDRPSIGQIIKTLQSGGASK
ncbi:cysteine-rich receptor-like protein kinase 26 [Oryza glaberrima]|uniref:cysteine-rich receptor-like protein kinase 26 n=1 Tax=Oryza glaberrima TaxID=4538 RepID=UPI00224C30F4|nr:cysteine-rich receptor-like protein kinase 26 [Oryza glaberrima]